MQRCIIRNIPTTKNYLHVEVVYLTERREYHFQIQGQLVVARWIYCDYINFALCKCSLEYSLEWSFWVRFTTRLEVVWVKFNRIRVFNSKYKKKFGRLDPVVNTVVMCLSRPYYFKFFKGCLPQVLLGPFLNTLTRSRIKFADGSSWRSQAKHYLYHW